MYAMTSIALYILFIFTGIIKAAGKEKAVNLETLIRRGQNRVSSDCYNRALKAAIEKDKCANAEKLILAGATNVVEVIELAKSVEAKLMLLMVKAVLEDDTQLIVEIRNIAKRETALKESDGRPEDTEHIRDPKYDILYSEEMVRHITVGRVRTRVPIKLTTKLNKSSGILDELLSVTNVNFDVGSVGWSNLSLTELDIKWIRDLPKHMVIKQLNLSQNKLSVLPMMASHLRNCTKLDLHQNNMTYVPASVLELPAIRELNLSRNKIPELPNVSWSASLVQLNLSNNELKTLPDCATELCDSMKVLRLEHNRLKTVPKCVCFLSNLDTLDISYNPEILVLPVDLGRLKELKQLILYGLHHLYDPSPKICENTSTCMSYLRSQFLRQVQYYHMKLMLVGKETVGKTTMVACLQGRQHLGGSTVGVDIGKWSYRPSLFKPTFSFSVWDFAGQQEYYATHQVFLSKRSLYLAVWNVKEGRQGISELKPWLNNIILRALESQILIVATHLDMLIAELGKEQAYAQCDEYRAYLTQIIGHDFIIKNVAKIMFVGLKGRREDVTQLKEEIYKAAENCKVDGRPIMGSNIPASYEKVDNRLLRISDPGILHAIEFKEIVRGLGQPDIQSDDEIRAVTLFLHGIGSLLHFDDHRHNLDDLYFVKPQWLSKLMSKVIKVEEKQRKEYFSDGKITRCNFNKLFKQAGKDSAEDLLEQYLMLFNRFEIALPTDKHGDQLLIPCFLPSVRPATVDVSNKESIYHRKFKFCNSITPPGLWSRLLSRLINTVPEVRNLMDQNTNQNNELLYWDRGLYCQSGDIVFVIESCPSQDDDISITYSLKAAQEGLLGQLVNVVQQIVNEWFPGLKFEQIFCCYKERCSGNFKLDELLNCIAENKPFICEVCNEGLDLKILAPDLLLDNMDPTCILDVNSIYYDDSNIIWNGTFGKIYRGNMPSMAPVIVKFYDTHGEDSRSKGYEVQFQSFQAEVIYLKRIRHPCLVGMKGVCKYPNMALVMEDGPMASLDTCLLKELPEVPRVVVYRIAAQIASALRFLHSIPIIYRHLTTSNILVWSLSLDNLVNCKLACLQIATYGDMEHVESTFGHQFIAPEVSKKAVYDKRVDIFSFGVVLSRLMQRSYPIEYRQSIPEWEIPLTFKSIFIPDSELHYMRTLAKNCCCCNPADRQDLQKTVEQLCDPNFQLVMSVTTFDGSISCACTGGVWCTENSTTASQSDCNTDVWLCHQCVDGSEIIALSLKGLKIELKKTLFIKDHYIYTMMSHGNCVWAVPFKMAGHKGWLVKFDGSKKDKYIEIPIQSKMAKSEDSMAEGDDSMPDGDYGVSLTCYDNHVYVGTVKGWCVMFPTDIDNNTTPILQKNLSCRYIRSMIVVKKMLWVSTENKILFINPTNLDQDRKTITIDYNDWRVGNFLLSSDEEIVWSVHFDGYSISAWKAQRQELICVFDSYELMDKRIDQQKCKIASASIALDTLWVGLISGHILVITATSSHQPLIIMEPYKQMVEALIPIYGKDNNNPLMISIGKVAEKQSGMKKQNSRDIVLWEAVAGKHMVQLKCLSTGNAWLNDTSINEMSTATCKSHSYIYSVYICLLVVQVTLLNNSYR